MSMYKWSEDALCLGRDTAEFFDLYENFGRDINDPDSVEDPEYRANIDQFCQLCPVQSQCLATGVSKQESGVWGGVYLEKGKISKEFNSHKTSQDWFNIWQAALMESK
jgi:hypothetical protein